MFNAIGFETNHKGFGALEVETCERNKVEELLTEAFGVKFEVVVIMKNGTKSPEVVDHWEV